MEPLARAVSQARRDVAVGIGSTACCRISYDNHISCYCVVDDGLPPNCHHVVAGCEVSYRHRTLVVRLLAFIIGGAPILITLPISIVVQIILTTILVVSVFLVPRVVVFLMNTIIVMIPLCGSISFVLAKSLVRFPTVALWFDSSN